VCRTLASYAETFPREPGSFFVRGCLKRDEGNLRDQILLLLTDLADLVVPLMRIDKLISDLLKEVGVS
jgi:hypothetical protein